MAESQGNSTSATHSPITFSFKPIIGTSAKTSREIVTEEGKGVHVLLNWYPRQILAHYPIVLELRFVEPSGKANNTVFDGNVRYDLKILDKD
jgi:hypothetical protein